MIKLSKRLFGKNVEIQLVGQSKEEVIQWRNFFYNYGAIQMNDGFDPSFDLAQQEKEIEENRIGFFTLSFMANKELVVNAFDASANTKTDWEGITERGGQPARRATRERIKREAMERFEAIPTHGELAVELAASLN